jgi:hypothetical protein
MCGAQLTVRDAMYFGFEGCVLLWLWPCDWGRIRFGAEPVRYYLVAESKQRFSIRSTNGQAKYSQCCRRKKKRLNGIAVKW